MKSTPHCWRLPFICSEVIELPFICSEVIELPFICGTCSELTGNIQCSKGGDFAALRPWFSFSEQEAETMKKKRAETMKKEAETMKTKRAETMKTKEAETKKKEAQTNSEAATTSPRLAPNKYHLPTCSKDERPTKM